MAIGVVVEYNPFHNGHIRQLNWIKDNFPNEKIIVVMSGKFTQRGELNVASFHARKKVAKKYGVTKVLKLSFKETVQAAHIFAYNAIMKLAKAGIDKLVFGSEDNNPDLMVATAKLMNEKQSEFSIIFHRILREEKGISYPKAVAQTIKELGGNEYEMPNDILGFEYVKVIIDNKLPIKVYTIKRNVPYNSETTVDDYASGTLLRKMIFNKEDISKYSPMIFKHKTKRIEDYYHKFQKIVSKTKPEKLRKIPMVAEGIENLFKKNINIPTYDLFVETCTSKRYTASRIKRTMAWILLKKW